MKTHSTLGSAYPNFQSNATFIEEIDKLQFLEKKCKYLMFWSRSTDTSLPISNGTQIRVTFHSLDFNTLFSRGILTAYAKI